MIGSIRRFFAGLGLLLLAVGLIYRKGKKDAEAVTELKRAKEAVKAERQRREIDDDIRKSPDLRDRARRADIVRGK